MDNMKPGLEAHPVHNDEPMTLGKLKDIFPTPSRRRYGRRWATQSRIGTDRRAFSLEEIAGGYQLLTSPQHAI